MAWRFRNVERLPESESLKQGRLLKPRLNTLKSKNLISPGLVLGLSMTTVRVH